MKIYSVSTDDGDAPIAFGTKREAMQLARACREQGVTVEELTLIKIDKAAIVRLVNVAGGYVEESRVLVTWPKKETGS